LEGHYYVHIGRFLARNSASLEIECIPKPTLERQGDEYIMDVVCSPTTTTELDRKQLKHYTDAEIRTIYYCKNYLQVKRISDLCTADDIFVLPWIAKGERCIRQCTSNLEEIKRQRPGDTAWLRTICKEEREQETHKDKTEEKHIIGTRITKYWAGKPFIGTVTNNKDKYYKIQYDENDQEELNHKEVTKYMNKHRGEGRATKEVGTRMRLKEKLGDWNITASKSERLWLFYYSKRKDTLYRSYRKEWHQQGAFKYDCHT
jgi:hypothetical protein